MTLTPYLTYIKLAALLLALGAVGFFGVHYGTQKTTVLWQADTITRQHAAQQAQDKAVADAVAQAKVDAARERQDAIDRAAQEARSQALKDAAAAARKAHPQYANPICSLDDDLFNQLNGVLK